MKEIPEIQQEEINQIWDTRWRADRSALMRAKFLQRLFIEGYPKFMQYVPREARNFLEVGAGNGRYGLKLAEDRPSLHVTLTDIVDEGVASMQESVRQMKLANVVVQKEDAFALSFPDGAFDVVFSDAVIQHLPDYEAALNEMQRVVRPGGLLIISSVNGWNFPHQLYKAILPLLGKQYPYGYEKNFTPPELHAAFEKLSLADIVEDGFYFAYGVYRWRMHFIIFKWIGGALNRVTKFIDAFTNRFISRKFGFEIFCVGRKRS